MKIYTIEKRVARLEKYINESLKNDAIDEIKNVLSYQLETYGKRPLYALRREIVNYDKGSKFDELIEELELNDNDALSYYSSICDDLYDCDELDNDIIDVIDELLHI